MSVSSNFKSTLTNIFQHRSSTQHTQPVSGCLEEKRRILQEVFEARETLLDRVFDGVTLESDAARQLVAFDARTLMAARDILYMPVQDPADLFAKYDTILHYEEFYLDQPALFRTVLRHMRQDAEAAMTSFTNTAGSISPGGLDQFNRSPDRHFKLARSPASLCPTPRRLPMRSLLLTSTVLLLPAIAAASPQCTLPPGGWDSQAQAGQPVVQAAAVVPSAAVAPPPLRPTNDNGLPPALGHLAAAGSQITEIGSSHGLRSVVARNGKQFMFFHLVPDGSAIVGGLISEMTPAQLVAAAGSQAKELGISHGLRGIFVDVGAQFQVFYVTPDGERVIAGGMWDATGHNVTADQVKPFQGTIATVEIGPGAQGTPVDAATPTAGAASAGPSALAVVERTASGTFGDPAAPKVYMFIDPMCSFSVRAMQQLKPLVDAKRLQVAVIPISILDYEDGGRSTTSTLAMLSLPPEQMVPAWAGGRLEGPPSPDAQAKLAANRAASEQLQLRGTPTLIWRKADGSEGRADGVPANLNALLASMGR